MIAPIPVLAQRAEVVTICGSSKFKHEILAEVARLTVEGKLVVSLGVFGHHDLPDYNWDTDASDLKTMLDALHRQKIDMADSVHVVNPNGYYGESTAREIEYARSVGKPVTFMLPDQGGPDVRWDRYLAMFGEYGMPREAFDQIAPARPDLGSRGLHRVWLTPAHISRDLPTPEPQPKGVTS